MPPATKLILLACGVFFLTALFAGVWKYVAMLNRPTHRAPYYVDTAHRAALLYSFACLVLVKFVEVSPFPTAMNVVAAAMPLLFFAVAIATYIHLGWADTTDNQFRERTFATTTGMWLLIAAEVGGFAVLFVGFLVTAFGRP